MLLMDTYLLPSNTLLRKLQVRASIEAAGEEDRKRVVDLRKEVCSTVKQQLETLVEPMVGFQLPGNRELTYAYEDKGELLCIHIVQAPPPVPPNCRGMRWIERSITVEVMGTRTGAPYTCILQVDSSSLYEQRPIFEVQIPTGGTSDEASAWETFMEHLVTEIFR
jgi:hypothetical protein